jgi:OOP family OmpA-OmpF porin
MDRRLYLAIPLIASFQTAAAQAADNKFYIGAGLGQSNYDTGVSSLTGSARHDKSDTGYKLFAGYNFNKFIAIEGHYADFGTTSLSGNTGDTFVHDGITYSFAANNVTLTSNANSLGVAGLFSYPITESIAPFVKIGLHHWEDEGKASSSVVNYNAGDDGTDLFFGIGINIAINDSLSARLEAERYKFDSDELDYFSIGLQYNF